MRKVARGGIAGVLCLAMLAGVPGVSPIQGAGAMDERAVYVFGGGGGGGGAAVSVETTVDGFLFGGRGGDGGYRCLASDEARGGAGGSEAEIDGSQGGAGMEGGYNAVSDGGAGSQGIGYGGFSDAGIGGGGGGGGATHSAFGGNCGGGGAGGHGGYFVGYAFAEVPGNLIDKMLGGHGLDADDVRGGAGGPGGDGHVTPGNFSMVQRASTIVACAGDGGSGGMADGLSEAGAGGDGGSVSITAPGGAVLDLTEFVVVSGRHGQDGAHGGARGGRGGDAAFYCEGTVNMSGAMTFVERDGALSVEIGSLNARGAVTLELRQADSPGWVRRQAGGSAAVLLGSVHIPAGSLLHVVVHGSRTVRIGRLVIEAGGSFSGSDAVVIDQLVDHNAPPPSPVAPAPNPAIAPGFTAQPEDITVAVGRTGTFSAKATGVPTPSLQWECSRDGGLTWAAIEGADAAVLTVGPVDYAMNGWRYRVIARNASGSVTSREAALAVPPVDVTGVRMLPEVYVVRGGKSALLPVVVEPRDATHPGVTWASSDLHSVAASDGKVTGLKLGRQTVSARTADGKAGVTAVHVVKAAKPVTALAVRSAARLAVGQSLDIRPVWRPVAATYAVPAYRVDDASIATVDALGRVTAHTPGVAHIAVTVGRQTRTMALTVMGAQSAEPPAAAGIRSVERVYLVAKGLPAQLPVGLPPDGGAGWPVRFASSDEGVAVADASGAVYGLAPGSATIAITNEAGALEARVEVYVVARAKAVKALKVDAPPRALKVGEIYPLSPRWTPAKATRAIPVYRSSASTVASVDEMGRVTARAPGVSVITVTVGKQVRKVRVHVGQ